MKAGCSEQTCSVGNGEKGGSENSELYIENRRDLNIHLGTCDNNNLVQNNIEFREFSEVFPAEKGAGIDSKIVSQTDLTELESGFGRTTISIISENIYVQNSSSFKDNIYAQGSSGSEDNIYVQNSSSLPRTISLSLIHI